MEAAVEPSALHCLPRRNIKSADDCELEGSGRAHAEEDPDDVSELNDHHATAAAAVAAGSGGSVSHRGCARGGDRGRARGGDRGRARGVSCRAQEGVPSSQADEVFNGEAGDSATAASMLLSLRGCMS